MTDTPENIPITAQEIRNLVDRLVRLEGERNGLRDDIKDIYTEAKSRGFNPKALREIVKREFEDDDKRAKRQETEQDLELMLAALGSYVSTPLGEAAVRRAS